MNTVPFNNTKEGNILLNNSLNTFYLWLYGMTLMVKDHSDSERRPTAVTIWASLSDFLLLSE